MNQEKGSKNRCHTSKKVFAFTYAFAYACALSVGVKGSLCKKCKTPKELNK